MLHCFTANETAATAKTGMRSCDKNSLYDIMESQCEAIDLLNLSEVLNMSHSHSWEASDTLTAMPWMNITEHYSLFKSLFMLLLKCTNKVTSQAK